MKKYNLYNNILGWVCFVVAAVTYLLTLEPTASFWDCPEFISQGYKLEVGHPPGNPIFMLAARFFVNFAFGDISKVALMVNIMSALLSAATILLLFWTVTHLVRRLIVRDDATEIPLVKMLVIFGSGLCGALAYTWSDTFWFSAVEGEVYAFSSFCTALVFWLILKWENRADQPHSDKYLILIAYVIGISIAVHLLNLLCIPAIGLVIYYRLTKNSTATGSLITLGVSAVVVGLILYGLVPGFIEVAQYFELFCVNTLHMPYNGGVLVYAILAVATFIWAMRELYLQRSVRAIRWSVLLTILFSGIPFIGDSLIIPVVILTAVACYLWLGARLPVRILNLVVTSILVIFVGYSSYALLLIRSSANPPMNQNAPDNVFSLASYLNREQYGERPLFYGQTNNSTVVYEADMNTGTTSPVYEEGKAIYAKEVKTSPDDPDRYKLTGYKKEYKMTPELNMLFPRIYSGTHTQSYSDWIGGLQGKPVRATQYVTPDGEVLQYTDRIIPTQGENMRFFLIYQLNHMYWRYFMWNFAGRQNDIQGNGEVNHGNWISGIPFIDNPRLGDQSLMPWSEGEGNPGHNVFYMLPLILGVIGLLWQALAKRDINPQRGIEQFWVVFFLFFMTGIAIVLYLNQTPGQPRERDYAFAGSFYAFAIWIGIGVAALWSIISAWMAPKAKKGPKGASEAEKPETKGAAKWVPVAIALIVGIAVPLQMVSQTWDDHDRSGRYTTRDFGMNYLDSLDENAIIFTNGDNDTFPLWYAQEVEGHRTDVRVVNLSYLTTDWYANQMRHPSYEAAGIDMQAKPEDYAYDRMNFSYFATDADTIPTEVSASLRQLYDPSSSNNRWGAPMMAHPNMFIPVDLQQAVKAGRITEAEAAVADPVIVANMENDPGAMAHQGMTLSQVLSLDMLATSIRNGWNRPVYIAGTVPSEYYLGLQPYMRSTGMAYEITPVVNPENSDRDIAAVNTDKAYRNITEKFRWGGLDKVTEPGQIYLDETVRRMVTTTRSYILDAATALINEAVMAERADSAGVSDQDREALAAFKADRYAKALNLVTLMEEKLPEAASPYAVQIPQQMAQVYDRIAIATGNKAAGEKARKLLRDEIRRYAQNVIYYQSLSPQLHQTLQVNDRFIEVYYMVYLLQDYADAGGDPEPLIQELEAMGVNFDRIAAAIQK